MEIYSKENKNKYLMSTDLSIIIPTYLRQQIVINTLMALDEQSTKNFEVIIIDQTPKISHQLKNIKFNQILYRYMNIEQVGLPNARNYGAEKASGDILIFIDDDSVPDKNLVKSYRNLFQSLGPDVLIGGRVIEKDSNIFKEGKNIVGGWIKWYGKTLKNFDTDSYGECEWAPGGNFAVSKKLFFLAGGFDPNYIGTAVFEDGDFGFSVKRSGGKVYYHPEPIIEHLRNPTGGVRQRDPNKGMLYRAHNTVYFFRKHGKIRFLLFVFIYLHGVALKDWLNKKHGLLALFWTLAGFYKGCINNIKK
jgi:glycosyltransferase involved in cell wall biosynthesis